MTDDRQVVRAQLLLQKTVTTTTTTTATEIFEKSTLNVVFLSIASIDVFPFILCCCSMHD